MTTPLDLDHLQRLCDEATAGPWEPWSDMYSPQWVLGPGDYNFICSMGNNCDRTERFSSYKNNAAFIAASRTALPQLIARVRELRETGQPNCKRESHCPVCDQPLHTNFHNPDCVWAGPEDLDYHAQKESP